MPLPPPGGTETGHGMEDYARHARNFLDCITSRQEPVSDLESGHGVVTVCHLANISLRTGRKLLWDAEKEEILNDSEQIKCWCGPIEPLWILS